MTKPSIGQRATRYAISWRVRIRRVADLGWYVARAVNLSVTGILVQMPRAHRVGDRIECEIDCFLRPGRKIVLRGVGEIVRTGDSPLALAAICFNLDGASLVGSKRRQFEEANGR